VRIVYGVQSTGKGHLSRLLGLLPLFQRDGHELLVLVTGRWNPPAYFLDALAGTRFRRFPGLPMVADGVGGISKRGTVKAFATRLPGLFNSFRKAHRWISAFDPDLIVSDFDPVTGSPFVAPGVFKVGIGNYFTPARPGIEHPPGLRRDRFNVRVVEKLVSSGLDARVGCHFYPLDDECLPPILRPETLTMKPEDADHIVVYHAFPGLIPPVLTYAEQHPGTPIILYGYETRPRGLPDNVRLQMDADRFLGDLASCKAFVGTAGFQSVAEAFYFGKKIVVQPIEGHYEQKWNAMQLELHGMGRWCRGSLEADLAYPFNHALHERLVPWYRSGAETHYERILRYAPPQETNDSAPYSPSPSQTVRPSMSTRST
jgi:uncharacterized protein (TIGR00661 family)